MTTNHKPANRQTLPTHQTLHRPPQSEASTPSPIDPHQFSTSWRSMIKTVVDCRLAMHAVALPYEPQPGPVASTPTQESSWCCRTSRGDDDTHIYNVIRPYHLAPFLHMYEAQHQAKWPASPGARGGMTAVAGQLQQPSNPGSCSHTHGPSRSAAQLA